MEAQLLHYKQQHTFSEAHVQKLRDEKRILKAVAKQYKEESERQGHNLALLRKHVAFEMEKKAMTVETESKHATDGVDSESSIPINLLDLSEMSSLDGIQTRVASSLRAGVGSEHVSRAEAPKSLANKMFSSACSENNYTKAETLSFSANCDRDAVQMWAERIHSFYLRHCPAKAKRESCEATARKFHRREGDLFTALFHKYAVPDSEQQAILLEFEADLTEK